jgi:UDP-N-acetylmuramoyl-tripeptide--D-alanyl-D-alanine ligase
MAHLFEALPAARRGAHAADSMALLPAVLRAVAPGDVVLVKGSLGSRMAPIVEALLSLASDGGELPRVVNGS